MVLHFEGSHSAVSHSEALAKETGSLNNIHHVQEIADGVDRRGGRTRPRRRPNGGGRSYLARHRQGKQESEGAQTGQPVPNVQLCHWEQHPIFRHVPVLAYLPRSAYGRDRRVKGHYAESGCTYA